MGGMTNRSAAARIAAVLLAAALLAAAAIGAAACKSPLLSSVRRVNAEYKATRVPPAALGAPTLTAADSQLTAAWDRALGASGYELYWGTEDDPSRAAGPQSASGTSSVIAGLSNGTIYFVWVRALNASGKGAFGTPASSTPSLPTVAPSAPRNKPRLTPLDGQLLAEWDAVEGATDYEVAWSEQNDSATIPDANKAACHEPSRTIGGLVNGKAYFVWVRAMNAFGASAYSLYESATPLSPPTAPGAPSLAPGDGYLDASWSAVPGATGYDVAWSETSEQSSIRPANIAQVSGPTRRIAGLANGTIYFVWLKAENGSGASSYGSFASAAPLAPPAAPSKLTLKSADGQITVSWTAVSGASSYEVYWHTANDASKIPAGNVKAGAGTSCIVSGLANGTTYYLWVKARNAAGSASGLSESASGAPVAPIAAPEAPGAPILRAGDSRIEVSWLPVQGASSYNAYVAENSSDFALRMKSYDQVGLASTSTSFAPLENGKIYVVWVKAVNSVGSSALGDLESAKTVAAPAAPSAVAGDGQCQLTWTTGVVGATGYDAYWSTTGDTASIPGTNVLRDLSSPATIAGLAGGTRYYFWVKAKNNSGGESGYSPSATGLTIPPAPGAASVLPSMGKIDLSWNPVTGATGYEVYWSAADSTAAIPAGNHEHTGGIAFSVGSLSNGTRYYVWLKATNDSGTSGFGTTATGTPVLDTYLLSVQAGLGGSINLPVGGSASVTYGIPASIQALPGASYYFSGWTTAVGTGVAYGDAGTTSTTATLTSGNATIRANFAEKVAPTLGGFGALSKTYGDPSFSLAAPTSNSAGALSYESGNTAVATISGNTVSVIAAGSSVITARQAAAGIYKEGSISATLTVLPRSPTLGAFAAMTNSYGDAAFSLSPPSSDSPGSFAYSSSNSSIASVIGSTVTIRGAGSCTITATQAAAGNYASGVASALLTVNPGAPTISGFSSMSVSYSPGGTIAITAPTSLSSGAFSYASGSTAVATISGSTVTIVGTGTSLITANQAAWGNYAAGSVSMTLTVGTGTPTLGGFGSISKAYGAAAFALTAPTSNSSGAFSYASGSTAVATISGSTVTIAGAGSSLITATQAAAGNFASGTIGMTLTVSPIAPTLSGFGAVAKTFGTGSFAITAPTSNSSGSFSYASGNTSVATISGGTAYILNVGTSMITATQAAAGNYTSGTISMTLTVNPASPTLGAFNPPTKTYGSAPFALTAPASNSAGAFSYASGNPAVATVSGNVVTVVGAGTSTITATQAAAGNYTALSVGATLTVNPAPPNLWNFYPMTRDYGSGSFILTQPSSNSPGSFSYASGNTAVATVSGNYITLVGAGTSEITATQAAIGNYASGSIGATLTVNPIAPNLGPFNLPTKVFGEAPFAPSPPTSDSAGTFMYTSGNPFVATVSGGSITIVGAGTCTITATQAPAGNYTSASTSATLTVNRGTPVLSSFSIPTKSYGDLPFELNPPTSASPGAISYTSDNLGVATVSGSTVMIQGVGTCIITAMQAANVNFNSASTTATLTVNPGLPVIILENIQWIGGGPNSGQVRLTVHLTSDGGAPLMDYGVASSSNPGFITYSLKSCGMSLPVGSTFTFEAYGLSTTDNYFKAYATNSIGTGFSFMRTPY